MGYKDKITPGEKALAGTGIWYGHNVNVAGIPQSGSPLQTDWGIPAAGGKLFPNEKVVGKRSIMHNIVIKEVVGGHLAVCHAGNKEVDKRALEESMKNALQSMHKQVKQLKGNPPKAPATKLIPEEVDKIKKYIERLPKQAIVSESKEKSINLSGYCVNDKKTNADSCKAGDRELGSLSEYYESGNRGPGTVSGGEGDPGGVSYGTYQFSSKTGTAKEFINSAEGSKWSDQFKGVTPGSKEFSDVWKKIASDHPQEFKQGQHKFIERTHYQPLVDELKRKLGFDIGTSSQTMQNVIWSTAVQHRGYSYDIIKKALQGHNIKQMTEADIIKAIYAERGRMNEKKHTLVHFKKVKSKKVIASLEKRFKSEEKDALTQLQTK